MINPEEKRAAEVSLFGLGASSLRIWLSEEVGKWPGPFLTALDVAVTRAVEVSGVRVLSGGVPVSHTQSWEGTWPL